MSTIKQLSLSLLIVLMVITSCKKEDVKNQSDLSDKQKMDNTTSRLLAFSEQLKLKSGASLPFDSANWYLEGLLNYEQANNNHQFDGLQFYYDTLVMYTSGTELTMTELNDAHTYFTNKLAEIAQAQNITDFAFDAVDITISTSGFKNGETQLAMVVGGGSNTVGIYTAFGTTDHWIWGMQGGKCDGYTGGGFSDAAQQLNYKFTHPVAVPVGYFTGLFYVPTDGTEVPDPTNPGPYCDYKIFYFDAGNTGIWPCLGPEELNYYLAKMPEIISAKKPAGKSFAYANATSMFFPNGGNRYYHEYKLWYGDFTINNPNN